MQDCSSLGAITVQPLVIWTFQIYNANMRFNPTRSLRWSYSQHLIRTFMLTKFHEAIGIFIKKFLTSRDHMSVLWTDLIVSVSSVLTTSSILDSVAPPSPLLKPLHVMAKGGSDALIFCLSSCDDLGKLHKFIKLCYLIPCWIRPIILNICPWHLGEMLCKYLIYLTI